MKSVGEKNYSPTWTIVGVFYVTALLDPFAVLDLCIISRLLNF